MLRVVADTNVYISAFNFGGVPETLLQETAGEEMYESLCGSIETLFRY